MNSCELMEKVGATVPTGYQIIDYRSPKKGEAVLTSEGDFYEVDFNYSHCNHFILEEVWTPKKGEVIMVWDIDPNDTRPSVFKSMSSDGRYKASATGCAFGGAWQYARPLTAEEKGE